MVAARDLKTRYDAVVFGKGPAASVFAIQMARRSKAVLLVPPPFRQSGAKPFGEMLAPRGEFLLRQMGIADKCLTGHYSTDSVLSSWREPSLERTDLRFDPHGRMWHLNRIAFDDALLQCATESGADVLDRKETKHVDFERADEAWKIQLDSTISFTAGHLVDATGRCSAIARLLGSNRLVRDRLLALSCVFEQDNGVQPFLIEAVSSGWWYSLPLPGGKLLMGFVTDPKIANISGNRRKYFWDAVRDEAPHTRLRAGTVTQEPEVALIESGFLAHMSGEAWLAIGDSAMTFDPLSSHGLTSAIEQAIEASEIVSSGADQSAISAFDAKRTRLFDKYDMQRFRLYRSVERFSDKKFWQARDR